MAKILKILISHRCVQEFSFNFVLTYSQCSMLVKYFNNRLYTAESRAIVNSVIADFFANSSHTKKFPCLVFPLTPVKNPLESTPYTHSTNQTSFLRPQTHHPFVLPGRLHIKIQWSSSSIIVPENIAIHTLRSLNLAAAAEIRPLIRLYSRVALPINGVNAALYTRRRQTHKHRSRVCVYI